MALLHNRVSHRELRERLLRETVPRKTCSFYRYTRIADPAAFRDELYQKLDSLAVFGRIYVAHEGINAQVSVPETAWEGFRNALYSMPGLDGMRLNEAVGEGHSFFVLKIKVRPRIVADGISDPSFDPGVTGHYLNAGSLNELLKDPDTIIVDMRNHYEYEVGHFKGAIEIPADTFRDQLPMAVSMLKGREQSKIVMYCTGGIRCEKASAWMLHNGFRDVHHLEGGIINYARQVKEEGLPNSFSGKNFVFDERMGERITDEVIAKCHQCGKPCDDHTNCANDSCHLLFIQCAGCREEFRGCCCPECAAGLDLPASERRIDAGTAFNKSRSRRKDQPALDASSS